MKSCTIILALCFTVTGCAARSGSTETVCASHFGKTCTSYEVRETAEGKFFRESQDTMAREAAQKSGSTFFPTHMPGESSFHYLGRVQSENSGPGGTVGSSTSLGGSSSGGSSSTGSSFGGSSYGPSSR